jgi:hypothetical protein
LYNPPLAAPRVLKLKASPKPEAWAAENTKNKDRKESRKVFFIKRA